MKLETILQLLYANKLEHIVSHAIRIDNNIPLPFKVGDCITLHINRSDLPEGKQFKKDEYWGNISTAILAINEYAIDAPYLVVLPSGKQQWIDAEYAYKEVDILEEKLKLSPSKS